MKKLDGFVEIKTLTPDMEFAPGIDPTTAGIAVVEAGGKLWPWTKLSTQRDIEEAWVLFEGIGLPVTIVYMNADDLKAYNQLVWRTKETVILRESDELA